MSDGEGQGQRGAFENPGLDAESGAFYQPLGDGVYQPTLHTQGAWQPIEQHMAPVSGLLTHAIDRHEARADLQPARLSFDILGMIKAAPSQVCVQTVRPGRTIELVEAVLTIEGRDVVRGRAWRLSRADTASVAGGAADPLPPPGELPAWDGSTVWSGGYIAALEIRADPANVPGRGRVWLRTNKALVAGETVSGTAAFVGLVDTANGIATRVSPQEWMYPNVDLTVHLFRQPKPGWVGFDTRVVFGPGGLGLTSSTLYDIDGPVGTAAQSLTVRPLR